MKAVLPGGFHWYDGALIYSAATTVNLIVALTSRCSLAVASYSPSVFTDSTEMALRSISTPLAASASARQP